MNGDKYFACEKNKSLWLLQRRRFLFLDGHRSNSSSISLGGKFRGLGRIIFLGIVSDGLVSKTNVTEKSLELSFVIKYQVLANIP